MRLILDKNIKNTTFGKGLDTKWKEIPQETTCLQKLKLHKLKNHKRKYLSQKTQGKFFIKEWNFNIYKRV